METINVVLSAITWFAGWYVYLWVWSFVIIAIPVYTGMSIVYTLGRFGWVGQGNFAYEVSVVFFMAEKYRWTTIWKWTESTSRKATAKVVKIFA